MNEKEKDKQIARFLKDNLPLERRDSWFVRKTMNRLPERRQRLFSGWEIASFVVSFLVLAGLLAWRLSVMYYSPVVQVSDYLLLCLTVFGFVFLGFSIVLPVVRRG
ncbi:MAG: hypothetical protein K2J42_02035 [Muribaculaceae bacterium]|nr:hypothetical protein [Muribaculaceae bacterium]